MRCKKCEKGISGKYLPPTNDAFFQHILQYSMCIRRNATTAVLNLPHPTDYGYVNDDTFSWNLNSQLCIDACRCDPETKQRCCVQPKLLLIK